MQRQTYIGGIFRGAEFHPWKRGAPVSPFSASCASLSRNIPLSTCLFQGSFTNIRFSWFIKPKINKNSCFSRGQKRTKFVPTIFFSVILKFKKLIELIFFWQNLTLTVVRFFSTIYLFHLKLVFTFFITENYFYYKMLTKALWRYYLLLSIWCRTIFLKSEIFWINKSIYSCFMVRKCKTIFAFSFPVYWKSHFLEWNKISGNFTRN